MDGTRPMRRRKHVPSRDFTMIFVLTASANNLPVSRSSPQLGSSSMGRAATLLPRLIVLSLAQHSRAGARNGGAPSPARRRACHGLLFFADSPAA